MKYHPFWLALSVAGVLAFSAVGKEAPRKLQVVLEPPVEQMISVRDCKVIDDSRWSCLVTNITAANLYSAQFAHRDYDGDGVKLFENGGLCSGDTYRPGETSKVLCVAGPGVSRVVIYKE